VPAGCAQQATVRERPTLPRLEDLDFVDAGAGNSGQSNARLISDID
jgi:hypothetical protein